MANPALRSAEQRADTLPSVFVRYRSDIDAALRQSLADGGLPLYQMLRFSMGWSDVEGNPTVATQGKATRPTLCLFACEATGGPVNRALPAAAALELVHNFSLIHDDVQDRDETRHHRPTLWAIWGDARAIVAGNALRVVADTVLWRLVDEGLDRQEALRVVSLLTQAYLEMIEGQYLDLSYERRPDVNVKEYLGMISRKTGALIRCALESGAMIGSGDPSITLAFRECGRSLGFLFQIRDDVLGIWGDQEATGKPVGADIQRKKSTLPLVYAMSQARGRNKELLRSIYSDRVVGEKDVAAVMEIMETVNAREYAESLAAEYSETAIESLSGIELAPDCLDAIEQIVRFLLARQH